MATRARDTGSTGATPDEPASPGLTLALVAGVLLRILALVLHPALGIDETRYLVTAHHLRHQEGYTDWRGPEIDILPLHPLITAALGRDPATLERRGRHVACAASIAGLFLFAILARRLCGGGATGGRVAVVAVWLVAVHPWLLRAAARPQPESLYVTCVIAGMLALVPIVRGATRPFLAMLSGGLFGLAYLARPEGMLVATACLGWAVWRRRGSPRAAGALAVAFAATLAAVALPCLVWLRGATGGWTLTGKTAEIFFIGQAMHANAGEPPSAEACLALQARYGSPAGFAFAHPLDLAARVARFAMTIFAGILPRALGPLGLAGIGLACLPPPRRHGEPPFAWWALLPTLALPLMTLTFPNERVAGTTLPFLLLVAASGLARGWTVLVRRRPGWRTAALAVVLALACVPWIPAARRAVVGASFAPEQRDREAAALARAVSPTGPIVTNSPVVSFYVRDPVLFGPPGRYAALEPDQDCASLAGTMQARGSRVAVLEQRTGRAALDTSAPGCRLALVRAIVERAGERRFEVLKFADDS